MATTKIGSFSLHDLSEQILKATTEQINVALEACGVQAVAHAVDYITSQSAIDTGLLRNSITYALHGETPHKRNYHGERASKYSKVQAVPIGRYEGTADEDTAGNYSVFIGTNVFYGVYIELGHKQTNGKKVSARPFIRPALENHRNEYQQIFEKVLSILGN